MAQVCRICLDALDEEKGSKLFYPCRCKAPVHEGCLQSWRTAGASPANLTRCEVCQYHYRLAEDGSPLKVHAPLAIKYV